MFQYLFYQIMVPDHGTCDFHNQVKAGKITIKKSYSVKMVIIRLNRIEFHNLYNPMKIASRLLTVRLKFCKKSGISIKS